MNRIVKVLGVLFVLVGQVMGQSTTQVVRGTVVDLDTQVPLAGANISVTGSDPVMATSADGEGRFRLENVPIGRVDLFISYIGFESRTISGLLVGAGKEVVLNIQLEEAIETMGTVEVTAQKRKGEVLNELAISSAKSFSVEETQRYAGSIDDPARMVSAFAGVNGDAQGNNDIVVRGNSPKGILWKMEGIQIPNPNHFANEGATGGPVNSLNSNMLANSDFYTGAFSPEYGNALSGVFDIKLRTGNNEKREYSATAHVMGLDFTVEGPFSSGYSGSYLANYRYSTLAILDDLGILDFSGVPKYQDASFKMHLPINDRHIISVFGLGGISSIAQVESDSLNEERVLWKSGMQARLGVVGLNHNYLISDKAYLKTTVAAAGSKNKWFYEEISEEEELELQSQENFVKSDLTLQSIYNHKINGRHKIRTGVTLRNERFDMGADVWDFEQNSMVNALSEEGDTWLLQGFLSWKYRISDKLTMVSGAHYLQLLLNRNQSLEPRLAMKWEPNKKQFFTLAGGVLSKPESVAIYLAKTNQEGQMTQPNKDLGLTKAIHGVIGYGKLLTPALQTKVELYYQHLYDVPVENDQNSWYSLLNSNGGYTTRDMVNAGSGTNYGLEWTLERFFVDDFYYMTTLSLYRSLYTGMDNVERSTAFDGNYVFNAIGGKEFQLGKVEKNRVLYVNTKLAVIGGGRYTPIDLETSIAKGEEVRDELNPFSAKGDDIIKWDLSIGIRRNKKNTTREFKIDVQNILNRQAVVTEYYNSTLQEIEVGNQLPLLPVIGYKIQFN